MRPRRRPGPVESAQIPVGRVTALTPSPRAPGRFDLVIDGEPVARLSIEGLERLRLQVGTEVGEAQAASIGAEADVCRVYDRSMAMLAARGRATGELRRLLLQKGESAPVIDQAISRLAASGFLDDARFSRQFARYRAATAGLSRRRIEQELWRRGVDKATAAEAIDETFQEEGVDESAAIHLAAEKKLRTLSRVDAATQRRRLYGFLARRGYHADAIGEVLRALIVERPADD